MPIKTEKAKSIKEEELLSNELSALTVIPEDEREQAIQKINSSPLKSIERKGKLIFGMTLGNGAQQAGRKSKAGLISRGLRSHEGERERQLLKHASTQLYFALDAYLRKKQPGAKTKLIEVQMMHVQFGEKHFVFVAANETGASQYFKDIIGDTAKQIQTILTQKHNPHRDVEGKRRSKLYAQKLKCRLFTEAPKLPEPLDEADKIRTHQVGKQLQQAWSMIDMNARPSQRIQQLFEEKTGGVYLIDNHKYIQSTRHAEEFLVDVAKIAQALAKEKVIAIYTCIAGKKRPCMSCSGRMKGVIDTFGARPGYIWVQAASRQSPETVRRTFETVLTMPSYVSLDGRGLKAPNYDSGSESEAEELETSAGVKRSTV